MPDSVIKWVNVWAENDNVAEGWKFLNQTVVPFGFHDYMAISLVSPIPTKYHEILAELPGVITEANTTQHEHDDGMPGDMDENFSNTAMAAAQNAGFDDKRNAPARPNVVLMDDKDSEKKKKRTELWKTCNMKMT